MDLLFFFKIVCAAFTATSIMTVCSYLISYSLKKLYKEPVLLNYFLISLGIGKSIQQRSILSWIMHYSIGLIFVLSYHLLWYYSIAAVSWFIVSLFALYTATAGVLGWVILFKISTYKPKINFTGYYIHIFLVHLVFTFVACGVYLYL